MHILSLNVAALGIAVIYYYWRDRIAVPARRKQVLRERITYMLWCAANQAA